MKRIISLCCIALILVTSMAAPVSASHLTNDLWISLLTYDTLGSDSNIVTLEANSITTFDLTFPYVTSVSNVDFIFHSSGGPVDSVSFVVNGTTFSSDITYIGDNVYRASAYLQGWGSHQISVVFDSRSHTYINALRFDISQYAIKQYSNEAYIEVSSYLFSDTIHYVPTDEVNHRFFTASDDYSNNFLSIYAWCLDWIKYDFLDYQFTVSASSINSITCIMGEQIVPIDVSLINSTVQVYNDFVVSVRVDLRGLDRTSDDYPMLLIEGNVIGGGRTGVAVLNVSGGLAIDTLDPEVFFLRSIYGFFLSNFSSISTWISNQTAALSSLISSEFSEFTSFINGEFYEVSLWISNQTTYLLDGLSKNFNYLGTWISNQTTYLLDAFSTYFGYLSSWISSQTSTLENAIRGDTSPGDSFQQQVDQKDQQFEDMAAVMDSVEKPDIQDINVSVDNIVSPADVQLLATPIAVFFDGQIFSQMIVMSILLATVSFVLFGKR